MAVSEETNWELPGIGCKKPNSLLLQKTSLASVESLAMPLVQEVVLSADFQCAKCQKRLADVISRMKEMESVVVNVLEKKVTLTCRYPYPYPSVVKVPTRQVAAICTKPTGRAAMFMRILRSFC